MFMLEREGGRIMEEEEYRGGITYIGHFKNWAPTLFLHAPSPPTIALQDGRLFYS